MPRGACRRSASTATRTDAERRIGLCNAGAMAFRVPNLAELLGRIGNSNAKSEYYLTDVVAHRRRRRTGRASRSRCAAEEALGVNSREQLATAEAVFQSRARRKAMARGRRWWRRRRCG